MFVAIDFDGTIVEHAYPELGRPVPGAIEWLKKFQATEAKLILWTMRSDGSEDGDTLTAAIEFCRGHGVEFDFINENPQTWTSSTKVFAQVYIDDTAFGCPLVKNPIMARKPYVDWEQVGPEVMKMIRVRTHPPGAIKDGWF